MVSVKIEDSVLFESTPSVHGITIVTLPQNHHVGIAVSQAPLMLFHSFSLTPDDVKLVLFIAFLVYEAQNVVYWMPSRYVSVHNQVLHLSLSSVYLLILGSDFSLHSSVIELKLSRMFLRLYEVVVKQRDLHVLLVYRPLLILDGFLMLSSQSAR